ncbi:11K [Carlavirus latensaconiti]|uniref:RNA silencing suppressor n=1 Tax=Carlavirus latensaconiti TaxID=101764 RepID=Q91UI8_9VIRU|nr:11K protein [Aconitum latent virus]BAB56119.1 11K [Aconitum latent virus]
MKWWREVALLLYADFINKCGRAEFALCVDIALASARPVGGGTSSYARKRRAKAMGRCHRCFRVWPPTYFTKRCDGINCRPGISHNLSVERRIKLGVTAVIPSRPN